jgi:PhnB protein
MGEPAAPGSGFAREGLSMAVKPIPDGYHSVTPYLVVEDAARLIDFMTRVFGAQELFRIAGPDARIGHCELRVGDSIIMLADANPEHPPFPGNLLLYVADVDATYHRAIGAGAISLREPSDQFYGDRVGGVKDPAGNHWFISTHKEDVPPEELERRAQAAMKERS